MRFYGKAEKAANSLLAMFQAGNVAKPLSDVFINSGMDKPCAAWSWSNQFLMIVDGETTDARGFQQWKKVGRHVRKGGHGFYILGPVKKTRTREQEDGTEVQYQVIVGFKPVLVFAREQTKIFDEDLWQKAQAQDEASRRFISELPLKEVAEAWGIDVTTYRGGEKKAKGYYAKGLMSGKEIALGVQNLSTWAHELIHAAEDRLGNLALKSPEGRQQAEIVAELGGAALLMTLGYETEADSGGAWEYVRHWSGGDSDRAVSLCMNTLNRVCEAVDCVLTEAEQVSETA